MARINRWPNSTVIYHTRYRQSTGPCQSDVAYPNYFFPVSVHYSIIADGQIVQGIRDTHTNNYGSETEPGLRVTGSAIWARVRSRVSVADPVPSLRQTVPEARCSDAKGAVSSC